MIALPTLRLTAAPLDEVAAGLLLVPVFEQDALEDLAQLDAAAQGDVGRAMAVSEFRGKPFDVLPVSLRGWKSPRALLVGAGARNDWSPERLRRLATAGALAARGRGVERVALVLRNLARTPADAQVAVEGVLLAVYDADTYKTTPRDAAQITDVQVVVPVDDAAWTAAAERGRLLGAATNLARQLANEPGNRLPPRVFAERGVAAVEGSGLAVDVLEEDRIRALNMGLLLGVGQGSEEPPRVIVMRHGPAGTGGGPVLGLVGKGITFDTGGISIKPAEGMERMKTDMSGGAAVIGAMGAIAALNAPIPVVGVVPCAENMPGGRAIRPGDVLPSASGKTVEVNNTDAEGRLVLADALWYAQQLGATHLVDVATLTGAVVVALGRFVSGLFGNQQWWVETVRDAAAKAGDRVWPMPIYEEALEQMKSDIADLVNTGGRYGGACTAAAFLREFTNGRPWAHLDIAGTAWFDEGKPWFAKGTTGVGTRTLSELAFTSDTWRSSGE
jgi:leucyl aminopeptidase